MQRSNLRHRALLVLSGLVLAMAAPLAASATTLLNEQFSYPNGNLVPNGGWANHSGTGNLIQVVNGEVFLVQGAGSREDANRALYSAPSATAKTYAGFNFAVTDTGTALSPSDYFAHFKPSVSSNFRTRVFVARDSATAGNYKIGIGVTSSGTGDQSTIYHPTSCVVGQTYKVVTSYNALDGSAELWVDPVDESSVKVVRGPLVAAAGQIVDTYALRQGGAHSVTQRISDLRVGTSLANVIVKGTAVPSMSQWGVMVLAAMLLLAGVVFTVRRRNAVA